MRSLLLVALLVAMGCAKRTVKTLSADDALANAQPSTPPVPQSAGPTFKPVSEADLLEVWTFIENRSAASGQMPTKQEITDAVVMFGFSSGPLVKDGSIVLTGATTRESVWAYEAKAIVSGGLVVTNNKVETMSAAELKRRLGK